MPSIDLSEVTMHYERAGSGPLLVLLHGWPETSACWRHVTPALSAHFEVVAPDLRGYGRSDKPVGDYTKRRMAQDIVELADALGHSQFGLVGHDRGARVAHRLLFDHPGRVTHVTMLDIAPTLHTMSAGGSRAAVGYWHWLFHEQPDLPERLVSPDIAGYLGHFFDAWTVNHAGLADAIPEYIEAFSRTGALRAGFDDYRATPTDLLHDREDHDAGHVIDIPVQVLWGEKGLPSRGDVIGAWMPYAPRAFGEAIPDCGHFIAEERPDELLRHLLSHHRH
ncbi:alpha/beta fold hydrolase [Microbacterium sp. USHLN186]|uniref:alpha/beta fold hydrolase n=1 Tax=Microbacterium sp. USHLN186 TaxID=3081286 RepID=UPI00301825BE